MYDFNWIRKLKPFQFWQAPNQRYRWMLHAVKHKGASKWYWAIYIKSERVVYGHNANSMGEAKEFAETALIDLAIDGKYPCLI